VKKLTVLLSLVFLLHIFFVVPLSFSEISIPNLQGTWSGTVPVKDTDWNGKKESDRVTFIFYIYQTPYVPDEPNLTVVPADDPSDPFDGFVQGKVFSLYKNNKHAEKFGGLNVGREIIIGTLSKDGKTLTGSGIGFDSNTEWGSTWSYTFKAKKTSNDVP